MRRGLGCGRVGGWLLGRGGFCRGCCRRNCYLLSVVSSLSRGLLPAMFPARDVEIGTYVPERKRKTILYLGEGSLALGFIEL